MPLGVSAHSMRSNSSNNISQQQRQKKNSPGRNRKVLSGSAGPPIAQPDQFSPVSTPSPTIMTTSAPITATSLLASDQKYPTTQALITDRNTVRPSAQRIEHPLEQRPAAEQRQNWSNHQKPPLPSNASKRWGTEQQQQQYKPHTGSYTKNAPFTNNSASYNPNVVPYNPSSTGGASRGATRYKEAGVYNEAMDVPGAIRRPMSFVKALEMSDALAMEERLQKQQQHMQPSSQPQQSQQRYPTNQTGQQQQPRTVGGSSATQQQRTTGATQPRIGPPGATQPRPGPPGATQQRTGGAGAAMRSNDKQYGSTYEISV